MNYNITNWIFHREVTRVVYFIYYLLRNTLCTDKSRLVFGPNKTYIIIPNDLLLDMSTMNLLHPGMHNPEESTSLLVNQTMQIEKV